MTQSTFGYLTPENAPLFTDLYELRMMQGYHTHRSTIGKQSPDEESRSSVTYFYSKG
ncbi:hypothetical protein [Natrarchaeobaculum sulfurireducens]|uniref:Nicotinic acid phosphoribosyltransferase n=1 Tax=Natrarchaeobaculum sulfurireducens TaxID=2044521 RepID=A0A346PD41_9EURY|nr:hypothetical protein [Natrarchaeobaculum sulfurireducens]AXR77436.1 Nicotinic acid phosphoribosyltransferase [Natrarchaeobaculum sulfurireducens]